ncbi:MAG: DUF2784 domain-containing protein [Betaproteobacteria bacterium]|nr:DUF2784 domain-containing protein [Betaproteobacteria bacterium]
MNWRLAADAVLVLHFAFIAFALLGGLLALRWRWLPLLHLPAAAWGAFVEISGRRCPLTGLENALRQRAGEAGYPASFVEAHLLGVIYPGSLTREVQYVLAGIVVAANVAIYALVVHRRQRRGRQ